MTNYVPPKGCKMPPVMLDPAMRNLGSLIFGYGRGSDQRQENTPIVQQDIIERLVATLNGRWGGFFCDEDQSGLTTNFINRPAAQCLVYRWLRPGDKLVIAKFDRMGRTVLDGTRVFQWAQDNGIDVHVANFTGNQRLDVTSATGSLMATQLLAFAQFESMLRSERVKETIDSMKARGERHSSTTRYGWLLLPRAIAERRCPKLVKPGRSKTVLIPHLPERDQIRQMWMWRQDGDSYTTIARRAQEMKWKRADGTRWVRDENTTDCGRPYRRAIRRAILYYEAMLERHGEEKWDDWTIVRLNTKYYGFQKELREKVMATLRKLPKEPGAAFRVDPRALDDGSFPAVPHP